MTTRTATRLLFALLVVAALGLSIRTQLAGHDSLTPSRVPAIDNPGPLGLEAAFLYLATQHRAEALDVPLTRIPEEAEVLVTALPYAQEAGPEERAALWRWVEHGGTLIVLGQHDASLGGLVPTELTPDSTQLTVMGRQIGLSELGSDIQTLLSTAMKPEDLVNVPATPVLPDALFAGVGTLGVSSERGMRPRPGEAVPLVLAGDTPVVERLRRGRGAVYLFAGPDVLTNARLDRSDNLRVLANLAARGEVYFDEYHHRVGASESVIALGRALAGPFTQLLFLGAIVLGVAGRRLGPVRAALPPTPRSTGDYARQIGQLYRTAHAEAALCLDLAGELRGWLERRLALGPGLSSEVFRRELTLRDPALASRAAPLLAQLEAAGSAALSPEQFLALTLAVVTLEHDR